MEEDTQRTAVPGTKNGTARTSCAIPIPFQLVPNKTGIMSKVIYENKGGGGGWRGSGRGEGGGGWRRGEGWGAGGDAKENGYGTEEVK